MTKPKTIDQLRAEKERAETQLAQEQHKLERLEKGDRPQCGHGVNFNHSSIGVKALYGGNLFLPQEVKGFHNLVEIANGSF